MQNWVRASSADESAGGTAPFTALQRGMCLKCRPPPDDLETRYYFPIVTCLLSSAILTLLLWLFRK